MVVTPLSKLLRRQWTRELGSLIQIIKEGTLTISAMPPIHHRDPGVIGLLGDPARSPYYGIIVDGLHSHPNTVRIAYGAKKDGCILVTDGKLHPVMRQRS
jgi:N-acetylglucosamine-6-phosphate deacetylase